MSFHLSCELLITVANSQGESRDGQAFTSELIMDIESKADKVSTTVKCSPVISIGINGKLIQADLRLKRRSTRIASAELYVGQLPRLGDLGIVETLLKEALEREQSWKKLNDRKSISIILR